MPEQFSPAEAVFHGHLAGGAFRLGAAGGRWRLVSVSWPYAVFAIRAVDGVEYGFRFDCEGYPQNAPTGRLWDVDRDVPLPSKRWPTGHDRIPRAFNPGWKNGTCIYLPCDRQSIEGHANWFHEHPGLVWNPSVGVVHYLRVLHDLLNSGDYGGRLAA
ncbi:MAG: hypothetical protein AB7Q01_13565 [Gammaproteobacteria bacterium]